MIMIIIKIIFIIIITTTIPLCVRADFSLLGSLCSQGNLGGFPVPMSKESTN